MGVIKEQVGSLNALRINTVNNCYKCNCVCADFNYNHAWWVGVVNYLIIIVFVTLQTSRFCDFAIFLCVYMSVRHCVKIRQKESFVMFARLSVASIVQYMYKNVSAIVNSAVHACGMD